MATWATVIKVTNLQAKRISVTATRTDGEDVWTKTVNGVVDPDSLATTRDQINGTIWNAWQEYIGEQASNAALLANYEAALAADLNTREGA